MAAEKRKSRMVASWRTKLEREHPSHGRLEAIPAQLEKRWGTGSFVIPRPLDVDAIMKSVRKGRLITVNQIRERIAAAAGATCACPMTTGIFVRIAAEAAEEDARAGRNRITPYWRTLKEGGKLNPKFPGGVGAQAARLRAEGFEIDRDRAGRPARVRDFEKKLITS